VAYDRELVEQRIGAGALLERRAELRVGLDGRRIQPRHALRSRGERVAGGIVLGFRRLAERPWLRKKSARDIVSSSGIPASSPLTPFCCAYSRSMMRATSVEVTHELGIARGREGREHQGRASLRQLGLHRVPPRTLGLTQAVERDRGRDPRERVRERWREASVGDIATEACVPRPHVTASSPGSITPSPSTSRIQNSGSLRSTARWLNCSRGTLE